MCSLNSNGRFTVYGGAAVESSIRQLVDGVGDEVARCVHPTDLTALLLIGGYGRGEGGVETRDGREQPHNNLDFLLLTRRHSRRSAAELKAQIDERLVPLAREWGVGLDLGVMSAVQLQHAPSLVMWYDLRFGHKTVLGDPDFARSLQQLRADRIPPEDVRNLLVNRGSLLIINDELREQSLAESCTRALIKHTVKAILGYGDAFLFHRGLYHWSYREKQSRFRGLINVDPGFQELYDQAMEFRFRPDYAGQLGSEAVERWAGLRPRLEQIHRWTEGRRFGKPLSDWSEYPEDSSRQLIQDLLARPMALTYRLSRGMTRRPARSGVQLTSRMALRAASSRDLIAMAFPVLAYDLQDTHLREAAYACLSMLGGSPADITIPALRRAYLRAWGLAGDPNFSSVASGLGLETREQENAA